MLIAQQPRERQGARQRQATRERAVLHRYRRLTLAVWGLVLAPVVLVDAWRAGHGMPFAGVPWAPIMLHASLVGLVGICYRERWLIRWSARLGAPSPPYCDPWDRALPYDTRAEEGDDGS
jgi:hypothetical protein